MDKEGIDSPDYNEDFIPGASDDDDYSDDNMAEDDVIMDNV